MIVEGSVTTPSRRNKKYKASLYELTASGQKQLLVSRFFETEKFKFDVLPERNLKLEVSQAGSPTLEYVFNTHDSNQKIYKNDFKIGTRPNATSTSKAVSYTHLTLPTIYSV